MPANPRRKAATPAGAGFPQECAKAVTDATCAGNFREFQAFSASALSRNSLGLMPVRSRKARLNGARDAKPRS